MGLHFQSEAWVPRLAQESGCYGLAIAAIPQSYHGSYLAPFALLAVMANLVSSGQLGKGWEVLKATTPWVTMSSLSHAIGWLDYQGAEVGELTKDGVTYWPSVKYPKHNYAIRWGRLANGTEHKTLHDWQLREIYNPKPGAEIVVTQKYTLYWYGPTQSVVSLYE